MDGFHASLSLAHGPFDRCVMAPGQEGDFLVNRRTGAWSPKLHLICEPMAIGMLRVKRNSKG